VSDINAGLVIDAAILDLQICNRFYTAEKLVKVRSAFAELIDAAQKALDKAWKDDEPHFARLNAALARVKGDVP